MGWDGNLTHSLIYSFTDNLKARDANASKNPPVSLYFFSEGGGGTPYVTLEIHGYADTDF